MPAKSTGSYAAHISTERLHRGFRDAVQPKYNNNEIALRSHTQARLSGSEPSPLAACRFAAAVNHDSIEIKLRP